VTFLKCWFKKKLIVLFFIQRKIRQHYYSAVSYTDSRIGLVLEELDKSGFADDTIIVMLGDHGTS